MRSIARLVLMLVVLTSATAMAGGNGSGGPQTGTIRLGGDGGGPRLVSGQEAYFGAVGK